MDIEKLKKLNQLTKELQKHSFAFNSDEAFKQAGKVFEETGQKVTQTNDVRENQSEANTSQTNSSSTIRQAPDESSDFLLQKKIELMLEMNNKKIAEELQNLRAEIENLQSQIQKFRIELQESAVKSVSSSQETSETQAPVAEKQEELQKLNPPSEPKSQDSHPRQGKYTPEDVSIEKMFYFGNKNS